MKYILLAGLCLALCACGPTDEERRHIIDNLPPECSFHDLGSYGRTDHLLMVECTGRPATTTTSREVHQCGKSTCAFTKTNIWIGRRS